MTLAVMRWLSLVEAALGALLLTTVLVLMLLQAVQRYLPLGGWAWTGELAKYSLIWLTFAMSGYLMARDDHVALKVVDYLAKGVVRKAVVIFAHLMVANVCLNLAYEAFALAVAPSPQTSPALQMPIGLLYVIPAAGLLLTAVRSVVAVLAGGTTTGQNERPLAPGSGAALAAAGKESTP